MLNLLLCDVKGGVHKSKTIDLVNLIVHWQTTIEFTFIYACTLKYILLYIKGELTGNSKLFVFSNRFIELYKISSVKKRISKYISL